MAITVAVQLGTETLDLCPECGAGIIQSGGPGHGMLCALPRDFPFDQPCKMCEHRDRERMIEAGRQAALARERAFFDAFFSEAEQKAIGGNPFLSEAT